MCARYSHQRIGTGTGGLGKKRTSGDHPNYSIVEIGQNTEEGPEDLRRLAVAQNPVGKKSAKVSARNSQMSKIINDVLSDKWILKKLSKMNSSYSVI